MRKLHRGSISGIVLVGLVGSGCVDVELPTAARDQNASDQPARFNVASGPITGLDFPGSVPLGGKTMRFKFIDPHLNGLPIYGPGGNGVTYIWRLYPREPVRDGWDNLYYTTFFWGNDDGRGIEATVLWDNGSQNSIYGAHPYPRRGHPENLFDWEIATEGGDFVQPHPLGVVEWDRWYTQAFVAWADPATGAKITRFYWDLDNPDSNHMIEHATPSWWGNKNPPFPALTWGDAPWNPGREVMDGILRGIQIYNRKLSLAEIQAEAANPLSTASGSTGIWYLNLNPTPSDIADQSGRGNHPVWVGAERPKLYTADPDPDPDPAPDPEPDTSAPSAPINLTAAAVSSSQIDLSWSASTDNVGVAGYRIQRGGVAVATVTGTTYQDTGLASSTSYSYTVQAYDVAGNHSVESSSASATTGGIAVPPPTDGLLAHWSFDEAAGSTANDASGNNFKGSQTNGARWATGKSGGAIFFDGVNDKVLLGTTFDIPALPFTITAWVFPRDFNCCRMILSKRDSYQVDGMRFQFDLEASTGRVRLLNSLASGTTFNFAPRLARWTHLAVVARQGATELYANGVLKQRVSKTFVLGSASGATAAIGDMGGESGENFFGRIDDVRVYNRALTAEEIKRLPGLCQASGTC